MPFYFQPSTSSYLITAWSIDEALGKYFPRTPHFSNLASWTDLPWVRAQLHKLSGTAHRKKARTFQGTNICHWDGTLMGTSSLPLVTWKSGCSAPSECTFGGHLHCTLGNSSPPVQYIFSLPVYGPVISQRGNIVCSQVYIDSNEAHHLCEWSVIWSPGRKSGRREIWARQKSCNKTNSNQFEHQI